MFKKRSAKIVPSSSSGVEREEEPKKKKIERVEKEEQRMKTNSESEAQEITKEIIEEELKKLKMKEFLISEFEKKCPVEKRRGGETHLHWTSILDTCFSPARQFSSDQAQTKQRVHHK